MNTTYQKLLNKAAVRDLKVCFWNIVANRLSKMLTYAQRKEKYHTVIRDTHILKLYEMEFNKTEK